MAYSAYCQHHAPYQTSNLALTFPQVKILSATSNSLRHYYPIENVQIYEYAYISDSAAINSDINNVSFFKLPYDAYCKYLASAVQRVKLTFSSKNEVLYWQDLQHTLHHREKQNTQFFRIWEKNKKKTCKSFKDIRHQMPVASLLSMSHLRHKVFLFLLIKVDLMKEVTPLVVSESYSCLFSVTP